VSAIQIKNVSPELHERLRQRARSEGRNLSDYARGVLERDLATPTTRAWLERLRGDEPVADISSEEIVGLIDEGRSERDEHVLLAASRRY
jgi:plasmid stability protein